LFASLIVLLIGVLSIAAPLSAQPTPPSPPGIDTIAEVSFGDTKRIDIYCSQVVAPHRHLSVCAVPGATTSKKLNGHPQQTGGTSGERLDCTTDTRIFSLIGGSN